MFLNCHTYYSLRYGTISIEELVEKALASGIKKLALTDINNTSAVFDFVALCQKRGIEPVVGVEFRNGNDLMYVCLARNAEGFSEINRFMTEHNMATKAYPLKAPLFKNVSTIYPYWVYEQGFAFGDNEYVGVRLKDINKLWKQNQAPLPPEGEYLAGAKNLDVKNHIQSRKGLCEVKNSKSPIPPLGGRGLFLQPVTFINRQGYNLHRLLRCIDENCLLSKLPIESQCAEDELFHEPAYLQKALENYPEIIENTTRVLAKCTFEFDFATPKNKAVFSSSKEADLQLLTKLAWDGFRYRFDKNNKEAMARIEKELKIIHELGFGSYFLITWDIIRYARSRGYFHVGRGSGANSIVAYCLQITDVDPIELDLYFERFINPFRTSPPDFDIDFSWDERDEIIDYVFKRYGADYVCLLATYVTFKDRSAFRELGKVFGLPKHEIDAMVAGRRAAPIPPWETITAPQPPVGEHLVGINNALTGSYLVVKPPDPQRGNLNGTNNNSLAESNLVGVNNPKVTHPDQTGNPKSTINPKSEIVNPKSNTPPLGVGGLSLKYGKLMEDFPNYLSIHAGGIMISDKPLSYYTALVPMPKGFPICQFDMYVAEDVGFAKFDVLSQRGLGHIKESVDIIFQNRQINVDAHAIQKFKNDPAIKKQVLRHETMGCFYIESPAMRQLIWKLRCDNYLTLVAASSIIRPGVASSGMMKAYIERHHDPSKVAYIHPKMKDLLQETYGVMVYQEDVIKVAHHFAGLTLAEADVLRRAMSGKYRSRIEFQKIIDKFFANCREFGYPDDISKEVWRQIESFSGYSFSKAHSASFAVESYQSLYLKTHFPREFMVAVINNFGGFYKTEFYIHEARRCGAAIEPPDVNKSGYLTHIEGDTIWLGWVHVKGLEKKLAEWFIAEAAASPFISFDDFCRRVPAGLEQLMILIRVGAFRSLGVCKKELLWEAHMKFNSRANFVSTGDLFALPELHYEFPALVHDPLEDAYDELELLGFTTNNPYNLLINQPYTTVHALNMQPFIGKVVEMVGYMVTLKTTLTKKGDRMVFGYFLDERGEFFDTVHFPKSAAAFPFTGWGIYHMRGLVMEEFGHCNLQVNVMQKLGMKGDPRAE